MAVWKESMAEEHNRRGRGREREVEKSLVAQKRRARGQKEGPVEKKRRIDSIIDSHQPVGPLRPDSGRD